MLWIRRYIKKKVNKIKFRGMERRDKEEECQCFVTNSNALKTFVFARARHRV